MEVPVGLVLQLLPSQGSLFPQRKPRCQSRPQHPRPRARRGCRPQDLRRGSWIGPPSRTAPGRRPAWTDPMRSPGRLRTPLASLGQGAREGGRAGSSGLQGDCPCPQLCAGGMWGPFLSTAGAPRGSTPALTRPQSFCSSPATTPQDGPSTSSLWPLEPASYHVVPIHSAPGQRQGRTSAPTTPDMQGRRGQSQSLR